MPYHYTQEASLSASCCQNREAGSWAASKVGWASPLSLLRSPLETGAILTAIIGANAATIGVVVAKDTKVSEFRQQWIDALREDIAKLCSTSVALYNGNVRSSLADRVPELPRIDSNALVELAKNLGYQIRLRLDKRKRRWQQLISALDSLVLLATHAQEAFDATNLGMKAVLEKPMWS